MTIRNVAKDDFHLLQQIKPSITQKTVSERLEGQSQGRVNFLILEDNDLPMSFVLLKWDGKSTHPEYPDIEDLYTTEDFRGRGYGTGLIKECEKLVRARSFNKIGLAVNPTKNSKAKVFYEKLGFIHDGKESYLDGVYDGHEDWVVDMEKVLK